MKWCKVQNLTKELIPQAMATGMLNGEERIVARYKEEPEGIILLATGDSLIEMIDDTVPDDTIFEVWAPIVDIEEDNN